MQASHYQYRQRARKGWKTRRRVQAEILNTFAAIASAPLPIADTSNWRIAAIATDGTTEEMDFNKFYSLMSGWSSANVKQRAFCRLAQYGLGDALIQMLLDGSVIVTAKAEFRLIGK